MNKLIVAFALLGLTSALAWAGEEEAPADATETAETTEDAKTVDCATLEGDEKVKCEADKAAGDTAKKGGKLKKSDDNRMESVTDE